MSEESEVRLSPNAQPPRSSASLDSLLADALTSDYPINAPKVPATKRSLVFAAACATLVTMVLGVALTQNKAQSQQNSATRVALLDRVKSSDSRVEALEKLVASAQYDLQAAEKAQLAGTSLGKAAQKKLERLRFAAGFTDVVGNGVRVSVQDGADDLTLEPGAAQPGRILDRDLQMIANGLWQAGASAVSINNRRLTATSAIRAAGEAILVDYRPLNPPFVIVAIAPDADALAGKFRENQAGLLLEQLARQYSVVWTLETIGQTKILAATTSLGGK